MPAIFLDTAYLIAVFNEDDSRHATALRIALDLESRRSRTFVTTPLVLAEFLAGVSRMGARMRAGAARYVAELLTDPSVEVVELNAELFGAALDLYSRRPDKSYSLTDCASMVICRQRRITEVLTADHDFEQEGFTILL